MEKKDLRSLTIEEMTELAESMGQKTFRGKQLFEWIHKKQVENLEEISNLPKCIFGAIAGKLHGFRCGTCGKNRCQKPEIRQNTCFP